MEIGDWIILILIVVGLLYLKVNYPSIWTPIDKTITVGAQALFTWVTGMVSHSNTAIPLINNTGGGG